ncbi:hypothetical protein ACS5PN_22305 [Roseateles sp. NT4]|uniref:hypothetical protein n=1 Tax=Roseateles sp. NT4 TaxID=3453715 RepID=UPI003EEB589A
MTDQQWKTFFEACATVLGSDGHRDPAKSTTWCAWTLFDRLSSDLHYWTCGLPALQDVAGSHVKDGGVWGQPFLYTTLAHIVIPRTFDWEAGDFADDTHTHGTKVQNLDELSRVLASSGVPHRLTDLVLEIKLY